MRKLFKASFFTFLKSKVGMILLSAIIFLTSATFTLLQSTAHSFNRSYEEVTTTGALHDFTVKEKYAVKGDVTFQPAPSAPTEKLQIHNVENVVDDKYFYIRPNKASESINDMRGQISLKSSATSATGLDTIFRIPRSQIFLLDSNNDGTLDGLNLSKGLDIQMYQASNWSLTTSSSSMPTKYSSIEDSKWPRTVHYDGTQKQFEFSYGVSQKAYITFGDNFADSFMKYINAHNVLVKEEVISISFPKPTATGNFGSMVAAQANWDDYVQSVLGKKEIDVTQAELDATGSTPDASLIPEVARAIAHLKNDMQKHVENEQSQLFIQELENLYGENGSEGHKLDMTSVKSTNVNVGDQKFKIVNGSKEDNVNKLVMFSGDKPSAPKTDAEMMKGLEESLQSKAAGYGGEAKTLIKTKEFRYDYTWNKRIIIFNVPKSAHYIDPSSFEAVVTPEYARLNNIKPISPSKVEKLIEDAIAASRENASITEAVYISNHIKDPSLNKDGEDYSKNVIWIDSTPYFITGTGTTPDFSYPIVDPSSPIPNQQSQAILFTNNHGYARIYDAFRGNQHEDYLAYKFTSQASESERQAIMDNVEAIAQSRMSWGKNVDHITSAYNDTSETVILAAQRVAFLEKLKGTISTISYLTTALLVIFSALVVSLVIKKTINGNKKNYAILRANGYSRKEIALSNTSIALIIGLASTALGYITGHSLQYAFIRMFDNYWTLPVSAHAFSWVSLVVTVGIPFVGIAVLAFAITLWEMRGSIPAILAGGGSSVARGAIGKIISPMKFVGIKTKTSLSLFLTNISKMVLIFVSAGAAVVALSTSISTMHKFDYAKTQSLNAKSYEYDLELATPTSESGVMGSISIEDLYTTVTNENAAFGTDNDMKPARFTKPMFHIPTSNDGTNQTDVHYLQNKIQFKAMLDMFMGMAGMGSNPWETASHVMPENQQNLSNKQNEKFLAFTAEVPANKPLVTKYLKKAADGTYQVKLSGSSVPKEYKDFIYRGMQAAIEEYLSKPERNTEHLPFFLSYGNIIMDSDDEKYTFIDGKFKLKAINGKEEDERVKIKGIDITRSEKDSNIKLTGEAKRALENFKSQVTPEFIPVIANEYFLTKYSKSVGDTFEVSVQNMNDRYHDGVNGLKTKTVKAKIVGRQETFNDNQLFTVQSYANQALGWTGAEADKVFNGIYTKHKDSILFKSISLYSQSGLYPGTDTIASDTANSVSSAINAYLAADRAKGDKAEYPWVKSFDEFINDKLYSASPYVMAYSNVNWSYTDEYRFDNVMKISSQLIYIIEGIVIALAVMFVIIISIMMINDNKKFIATLKVMGYRENEISRMVFAAFLPSLILAFFVAAPIAFSIVLMLKVAIMGFGAILVPLTLTWWTIAIAFGIIVLGIVVVYWLSSRQLKNTSMLQAFQE